MFAYVVGALLALSWVTVAQEAGDGFTFTMPASPAPYPGQPYTLTWTGGHSSEAVYIILSYYFPDTPNQDIPYITVDILCK